MIKPKALKKGDVIGMIAPAGPAKHTSSILKAIAVVKELGFHVVKGQHLQLNDGYLAGSDRQRAADVNAMFRQEEIDGIFCLRGGYGCHRMMHYIDEYVVLNNPKVFVGYSDITALHTLFNNLGLITFHGPMPAIDNLNDTTTRNSLLRAVSKCPPDSTITILDNPPLYSLFPGCCEGELTGGNLTLLSLSIGLGYPYEPDFTDKILFIEDIHIQPYQLDGYLTHLKNAGKLDKCCGYLIGDMKDMDFKAIKNIVSDRLASFGKPILCNYMAGHCTPNKTLALGARYRLDATALQLTMLEPCIIAENNTTDPILNPN